MKSLRVGIICLVILLSSMVLVACGEDSNTKTLNQGLPPTSGPNNVSTGSPGATSSVPGSKTAVPFFSVSADAGTPRPTYILAFDFKPGTPVLDASITTPLPEGHPDDWSVTVDGNGTVKYIKNPRSKTGAVTVERYLSQDATNNLLQQLNGLGVIDWPDTTAPNKVAAGGASRSMHLYLRGRTKSITDLSGGTGDGLAQMLTLIQQTVESAPATKGS